MICSANVPKMQSNQGDGARGQQRRMPDHSDDADNESGLSKAPTEQSAPDGAAGRIPSSLVLVLAAQQEQR